MVWRVGWWSLGWDEKVESARCRQTLVDLDMVAGRDRPRLLDRG